MSRDIKAQQQEIEQRELAIQPDVEKKAIEILNTGGMAACSRYLTDYSTTNSISTVSSWWKFSDNLVAKYSNQVITDPATGAIETPGYPDWWLEESKYQYGPRVYDYEGLQKVPGLAYTNKTVLVTPGNEVNYIRKTQQKPFSGTSFDPITMTLGSFREWINGRT
jgi:hypothetical protein